MRTIIAIIITFFAGWNQGISRELGGLAHGSVLAAWILTLFMMAVAIYLFREDKNHWT